MNMNSRSFGLDLTNNNNESTSSANTTGTKKKRVKVRRSKHAADFLNSKKDISSTSAATPFLIHNDNSTNNNNNNNEQQHKQQSFHDYTITFEPGPIGIKLEPILDEFGCRVMKFVDSSESSNSTSSCFTSQARRTGKIREGDILLQINSTAVESWNYKDIILLLKALPAKQPKQLTFRSVWAGVMTNQDGKQQQQLVPKTPSCQPSCQPSSLPNSLALFCAEGDMKSPIQQDISMLSMATTPSFSSSSIGIMHNERIGTAERGHRPYFSPSRVKALSNSNGPASPPSAKTPPAATTPTLINQQQPGGAPTPIFKKVVNSIAPTAGAVASSGYNISSALTSVVSTKLGEVLVGRSNREFDEAVQLKMSLLHELSQAKVTLATHQELTSQQLATAQQKLETKDGDLERLLGRVAELQETIQSQQGELMSQEDLWKEKFLALEKQLKNEREEYKGALEKDEEVLKSLTEHHERKLKEVQTKHQQEMNMKETCLKEDHAKATKAAETRHESFLKFRLDDLASKHEEEIKTLRVEREERQSRYEMAVNAVKKTLEAKELLVVDLKESHEKAVAQLEQKMDKEIAGMKKQKQQLDNDLQSAKKEIGELKVNAEEGKKVNKELESNLDEAKKVHKELESNLDEASAESKKQAELSQMKLQSMKELLAAEQLDHDATKDELEKSKKVTDDLQNQLDSIVGEQVNGLQSQLAQQQQGFDAERLQFREKIQSLEEQLKTSMDTLQQSDRQAESLEDLVHTLRRQLKEAMDNAETAQQSLEEQLKEKQQEVIQQRSQLEETTTSLEGQLKQSKEKLEEAMDRAENIQQSLEEQLKEKRLELEKVTQQRSQLEETTKSLEEKLKKSKEKQQELEEVIQEADQEAEDRQLRFEETVQTLQDRLDEAQDQHETAKIVDSTTIEGLKATNQQLIIDLNEATGELRASLNEANGRLAVSEELVSKLEKESVSSKAETEEKFAKMKQEGESQGQIISDLRDQIETKDNELDDYMVELKVKCQDLEKSVEEKTAALKQQENDMCTERDELQRNLEDMEVKLEATQTALDDATGANRDLKVSAAEEQSSAQELETEVSALKEERDSLKARIKEIESALAKEKADSVMRQDLVAKLTAIAEDTHAELERFHKNEKLEKEVLEKKIESCVEENEMLKQQISDLQLISEELETGAEEAEEQTFALEGRCESLSDTIQEMRERIDELEDDRGRLADTNHIMVAKSEEDEKIRCEEIDQLKEDRASLQTKADVLRKALDEAEMSLGASAIDSMKRHEKEATLEAQLKAKSDDYEKISVDLESALHQLGAKTEDHEQISSELEFAISQVHELTVLTEELEECLEEASARKEDAELYQNALAETYEQCQTMAASLQTLEADNTKLLDELTACQSELDSKSDELEETKITVDQLQSQHYKSLQEHSRRATEKMTALREAVSSLEELVKEMQSAVDAKTNELSECQQSFLNETMRYEEEKAEAKTQNEIQEKFIQQIQEELDAALHCVDDEREEQRQEFTEHIFALEGELQKVADTNALLESDLVLLRAELNTSLSDRHDLESEVKALRTADAERQAQSEEVVARLEALGGEMKGLMGTNENLESELAKVKADLETAVSVNDYLESQLKNVQAKDEERHQAAEKNLERDEGEIQRLVGTNALMEKELVKLREKLEASFTVRDALEGEVKEAGAKLKECQTTLEAKTRERDQLEYQRNELRDEIIDVRAKLEPLKRELNEAIEGRDTFEGALNVLKENEECHELELQREIANFTEKVEALQDELENSMALSDELQTALNAMTDAKEKLLVDLQETTSDRDSIKERLHDMQRQFDSCSHQLKEAEMKLNLEKSESDGLRRRLESELCGIASQQIKINELMDEIKTTSQRNDELRAESSTLKTEISSLKNSELKSLQEMTAKEQIASRLQENLSESQQLIRSNEDRVKQLEDKLLTLKDSTDMEYQDLVIEIADLKDYSKELEGKCRGMEQDAVGFQEKIDALKKETAGMQEKIKVLTKSKNDIEKEADALAEEMLGLRNKHEHATETLASQAASAEQALSDVQEQSLQRIDGLNKELENTATLYSDQEALNAHLEECVREIGEAYDEARLKLRKKEESIRELAVQLQQVCRGVENERQQIEVSDEVVCLKECVNELVKAHDESASKLQKKEEVIDELKSRLHQITVGTRDDSNQSAVSKEAVARVLSNVKCTRVSELTSKAAEIAKKGKSVGSPGRNSRADLSVELDLPSVEKALSGGMSKEERLATAGRMVQSLVRNREREMVGDAFRGWATSTKALKVVSQHAQVTEIMARQLETTREKVAVLKTHIRNRSQSPAVRRVV